MTDAMINDLRGRNGVQASSPSARPRAATVLGSDERQTSRTGARSRSGYDVAQHPPREVAIDTDYLAGDDRTNYERMLAGDFG